MIVDIIVEIPKGSRNKYELDKETGRIKLDRVLKSSVAYPADYGFMPDTLSSDGDPLDFLVINRFPTFPGCVIPVRPIAVVNMIDSGEEDAKIFSVPAGDSFYDSWNSLDDIPDSFKLEVEEFFKTYKNLEKGKYTEITGWGDVDKALAIISSSIK